MYTNPVYTKTKYPGRAFLCAAVVLSTLWLLQPASAQMFFADFEDLSGVNDPALWVPDNTGQAWGIAAFPGSGAGLKNLNEGCGTSGNTPLPGVTNFKDGIIQLDMSWEDDDSWGVIFRKTADDAGYIVFFGYVETQFVIIGDLANGCAPEACLSDTTCENGGGEIISVGHGLGGGLTQDLSVSYTGRVEVRGNTIKVWYLPTADILDPLGDLGPPLIEIQDDAHLEAGSVGIWHESQGGSMIDNVMVLVGDPAQASAPNPGNEQTDVEPDSVLTWNAGDFAQAHNVYFGTSFDDVNTASVADPLGVLVSEGQVANSYDPGRLDLGQTYYWRVDEVNGAPDRTVHMGNVWSFTAEPVAYPLTPIAATASSSGGPDTGPDKTIDSSGLVDGLHGTTGSDMWLNGPGDASPFIQYELDQVYKLHEMTVWNSNQLVESFIGLGVKEATLEVSLDGETWTALDGVVEFSQAPGAPGYAANTMVALGDVMAKFVKVNIVSGYGMLPQYSLSEVRFSYIPVNARELEPVGLVDDVDVMLKWRPGREAVSHEVVFGADEAAVIDGSAVIATVMDRSLDVSDQDLQFSTTYFWRVNEINEAGTPPRYEGEVVSFTTPDYGTVDDFEQYDNNCNRIFFAWEDGLGHSGGEEIEDCEVPASNGNGGGSIVGNDQSPFAERTIVNPGGSTQSMPFNYDNGFGPSEATLSIDGENWSGNGIQTLSLAFHGEAGNTGTLYVKINNTKISYDLDATHIAAGAWLAWNIDLTGVSGLQNVTSFTIGVDGASASGMLYIDDIRLYPLSGELITPADPGTAGLVAKYSFEGDASDVSGNGHNGTVEGNALFAPGKQGNALSCDGFDDFVSTGRSASELGINGNNPRTVTCWAFTRAFNNGGLFDVGARVDGQDFCLRTLATDGDWRVQYWGGAFDIDFTLDAVDTWVHFTHVYDGAATQIYANGILVASGPGVLDTADTNPWQIGVYGWQNDFYDGLIDELHLFNRALSAAEALSMAGHTGPIHKPF